MIAFLLVYLAAMVVAVLHLDRRQKAAQRRREALHFHSITGLLL